MKKIIKNTIFILVFSILFLGGKFANASLISISSTKDSFGMEEEFFVDVMIDTEGLSLNGIEGQIKFDKNILSLIRVEEGKSIINLWIDKPKESNGSIRFSGIIPNGFDGVIDPFNSKDKLPGPIIRLVFKGLRPGETSILTSNFNATLNDGNGTLDKISDTNKYVIIKNIKSPSVYRNLSDVNPELSFEIVKDKNLYGGKYVLVFDARDKETGIDKVMIKEGRREWIQAESPYLLKDQSRHSDISILAINHSGVSIVKNIDGLPYNFVNPVSITVVLIIIIIFFIFLIKKIHAGKYIK